MTIVQVAVDVPVAPWFDYVCDDVSPTDIGARVLVPLGSRTTVGIVLNIADASSLPVASLKRVIRVYRDASGLSDDMLRLLRFAADYYHHPLGQVVLNALPQRLRKIDVGPLHTIEYALTAAGRALRIESLPVRARAKRTLLATLQAQNALAAADAKQLLRSARAALRDFISDGWVEQREARAALHLGSAAPGRPSRGVAHTAEQERAIEAIKSSLGAFRATLLWGVTGSGKTEVYLGAVAAALAAGRQVLMLVPEIALTPQLEAIVRERFSDTSLASLHSGLNDRERCVNWSAARRGSARIVLGTRLAVFTPMPDLGLIIVDEEHDASLKQSEGFCYSARDLAVIRARQIGIPVVLGSATPSLESYHNARIGRYTRLDLAQRINGLTPSIRCVPALRGAMADGVSAELADAIEQKLARREQTLVFINRRGYAPVLMCHSCGWLSGCHRCSAQLVLHMPGRELNCHHCGHRARVPKACPECGDPALSPIGQGTQRVSETLERLFPSARILRVDRDSTRRKKAWTDMRERIRLREVDILVGTQMLAKGHDFPHLALVGVLNADAMLYSADFRASERLYSLLTQVAGRAGRRDARGEVIIQTEFPSHSLYAALQAPDREQFFEALLDERRRAGFPPFVYQALLRAEAPKVEMALAFLSKARRMVPAPGTVNLYDPVPAAMVRLAGRERAQLLVQSASRRDLHDFLSAWRTSLSLEKSPGARWSLEIDPLEL